MSDHGKETLRPPSRRTQRYQKPNPNQDHEGRRTTLKWLGAGVVAISAAATGINRLSQPKKPDSNAHSPSIAAGYPSSEQLTVISSEYTEFVTRLNDLDQEAIKNPQKFAEIAPRVGQLAIEFFCREMGYDPKIYDGKARYLWNDEYKRASAEENGCITVSNPDDEYGYVNFISNYLQLNLSRALYGNDPNSKTPAFNPAVALFSTMIHELHHLTSPLLQNPESSDPNQKIRGMGLLRPNLPQSKSGLICYNDPRIALEEAIVVDSTRRMINKLGIGSYPSEQYKTWSSRYKSGVIDRLFNGDHMPLLKLQQQSKGIEFFTLIGQKLNYPQESARGEGENYLARLITQGIY